MSQAQYVVDTLKAEIADLKVDLAVAKHTLIEQEAFIVENAPKLGLKVETDEQGRKVLVPLEDDAEPVDD